MGVKSGIQVLYFIIGLQRGDVADIAHAVIRALSPTVHWCISQRDAYHDMLTRLAPGMQSCIPPLLPTVHCIFPQRAHGSSFPVAFPRLRCPLLYPRDFSVPA